MSAPEPLMPEPWVVRENIRETDDVVTLVLEPGDGARPMSWQPGQFNMLYAFGNGEVPISISGRLTEPGRLVHTIRNVGLVTDALCRLGPGDVVGVRGPFGSEWPVRTQLGRDIVIVAGGIGLAPLRPVLYHVLDNRDAFDDVVVLYGARRPEELLFTNEYEEWRRHEVQLMVTVDHAPEDWAGHVGVVTTLIRYGKFETDEASAFLCGPEVMMLFTARELEQKGVDVERTWLSMERNMKCAVGFCGHCQLGPEFICLDGPVFTWPRMRRLMTVQEL
jgi:NAD(P)H-flavin reductase